MSSSRQAKVREYNLDSNTSDLLSKILITNQAGAYYGLSLTLLPNRKPLAATV